MKIFKESQRFNQWWLILIGLITVTIMGYSYAKEFRDSGNILNDELLTSVVFSGGNIVLVFLLIIFIRLQTKIDEQGISYQFIPFHIKPRLIPWADLSACYVRKYSPISEFGGWGIRGLQRKGFWDFRKKGMAFNIKGDMGIQLIFKDGGKLLIGTQIPEKAEKTIQNYLYKIDQNNSIDHY